MKKVRWCLLCCALLVGLCVLEAKAYASAMTLGRIVCVVGKRVSLQLHWGQSCAGGRSCSRMMSISLRLGKRRYELIDAPKLSRRERRRRQRVTQRWMQKQRSYGGRRRFFNGRPSFPSGVKRTMCRVGKKRYYYRRAFKDWRGRRSLVEILATGKGYKFRVRGAYNRKARTRGWVKGAKCTFFVRRNFPTCRALRKQRKRRKR